jgi:hypothetical protein
MPAIQPTELRICVCFCVLKWFEFWLELGVEAIATEASLPLVLLFESSACGRLNPGDYSNFVALDVIV